MPIPVGALYGVGQRRLREELTKEASAPALMAGVGALAGLGGMWRHQHLERAGERFLGDLNKMSPEVRNKRRWRRVGELAAATAAGAGIGTGSGYGLRYAKGRMIDTARSMGKAFGEEAMPLVEKSVKDKIIPAAEAAVDRGMDRRVFPVVNDVKKHISETVPQLRAIKEEALEEVTKARGDLLDDLFKRISTEREAAVNQVGNRVNAVVSDVDARMGARMGGSADELLSNFRGAVDAAAQPLNRLGSVAEDAVAKAPSMGDITREREALLRGARELLTQADDAVARNMGGSGDELLNNFRQAVGDASRPLDRLGAVAEDALTRVPGFTDDLLAGVSRERSALMGQAEGLVGQADALVGRAGGIVDSAGRRLTQNIDDALTGVGREREALFGGAQNLVDDALTGVGREREALFGGAQNLVDNVGREREALFGGAQNLVDDALTGVGREREALFGGAQNLVDNALTGVGRERTQAISQAQNAAQAVVNNASQRAAGLVDQVGGRADGLLTGIGREREAIFGGARGLVDQAGGRADDLLAGIGREREAIFGGAQGLVDQTGRRIDGVVNNAAQRAAGLVDHTGRQFHQNMGGSVNDVLEQALQGVGRERQAFMQGADGLVGQADDLIGNALHHVTKERQALAGHAGDLFGRADDLVRNVDLVAQRNLGAPVVDIMGRAADKVPLSTTLGRPVNEIVDSMVAPFNRGMDAVESAASGVAGATRKTVDAAQTRVPGFDWMPSFLPKVASAAAFEEVAQVVEYEKRASIILDGEQAAAQILSRM